MRSRLNKNTRRRALPLIFGLLVVILVGVGITLSGTLFRVAGSAVSVFSVNPTELYNNIPRPVLAERLADAEEKLSRVAFQSVMLETLQEENQQLKKELGLREARETGIGRVISRPPRTHYDTLLVSLTEGHSVSRGDIAVFEGAVLGEVLRTNSAAAVVQLFSAPGVTNDVRVGEPSAIVVIHGLGGGSYVFDVSDDVALEPGDVLISARYGTHTFGVVSTISEDPDRTTKRVYAHLPAPLSDIRFIHFLEPAPQLPDAL